MVLSSWRARRQSFKELKSQSSELAAEHHKLRKLEIQLRCGLPYYEELSYADQQKMLKEKSSSRESMASSNVETRDFGVPSVVR